MQRIFRRKSDRTSLNQFARATQTLMVARYVLEKPPGGQSYVRPGRLPPSRLDTFWHLSATTRSSRDMDVSHTRVCTGDPSCLPGKDRVGARSGIFRAKLQTSVKSWLDPTAVTVWSALAVTLIK